MQRKVERIDGRRKWVPWSLALVAAGVLSMYVIGFGQRSPHGDVRGPLSDILGDTNRVWELRDLAFEFQSVDPDSSIYYSRLGYDLAQSIDFPSGRIWNLYQEALAYEAKHEFATAFSVYARALNLAEEHEDRLSEAKLYNGIGAAHYFAGNHHDAVVHYSRAFSLSDSIGYAEGKAHALNNMGVIYSLQRRYDKALDTYKNSLELKKAENDTVGTINSLYNLGLTWSYLNDHEASLSHLLEARHLAGVLDDSDVDVANIDIGIGVAYYNVNEGDRARRYLRDGVRSAEGAQTAEWISGMTYLGALDVRDGRASEGLARIEEAYQLAVPSNRLELLRRVLRERALAADAAGDHQLAVESWRDYSTLSDSLHTESSRWAQEEMQARFGLQNLEITIARQNLQIERETAQKTRYLISGLSLAFLLLTSVLFLSYIWKQREQLKTEISIKEEALKENDLLLHEMHHRIKNNLQLLNSLLSLQSQNTESPEARRALQSSRDTVGAIGLLHHQLYRSADFRKVPLAPYVRDLVTYFNDAFGLKARSIELEYSCDTVDIDIDKAIPIGLVMNELVTNAIKHAFESRAQGSISLDLTKDVDRVTLLVADDGAGIHEHGAEHGAGRRLLKIFGDKLKADFDYSTSNSGTVARFSFSLHA